MIVEEFISRFKEVFPEQVELYPWQITDSLYQIIRNMIAVAGNDYKIENDIAIHKSAVLEQNVIIKGPVIIAEGVFISANAYLRGPLYLDKDVKIGAGCELKQSIIFTQTAIAHFNYIGNSIIGSHVNFEAGAIAANHFNEREDKRIFIRFKNGLIDTGTNKFGSVVGDGSRIGANAVLSPGTILGAKSIVGRLQLIKQYEE